MEKIEERINVLEAELAQVTLSAPLLKGKSGTTALDVLTRGRFSSGNDVQIRTEKVTDAPAAGHVCCILWSVYATAIIVGTLIVLKASVNTPGILDSPANQHCHICGYKHSGDLIPVNQSATYLDPTQKAIVSCGDAAEFCFDARQCKHTCAELQGWFMLATDCCPGAKRPSSKFTPGALMVAVELGHELQEKLQSVVMVSLSLVAVIGCAITSAILVVFSPDRTPPDFEGKGTLSNVSQDATKANGRLFAVSLFIGGLFAIISMYTFQLYRPWIPGFDFAMTPFIPPHSMFEGIGERMWRIIWVMGPHMGLMFTAAVPSFSNTSGYRLAMTIVHNVSAPIALAFMVIMETVQLEYGEQAFSHFFSNEGLPFWAGEITVFQRFRCVIAVCAWLSIAVFLCVQIYYGVGDIFGIDIKKPYSLALVSFFGEVTALIVVFSLPPVAGLEALYTGFAEGTVMDMAKGATAGIHWGPWPPINTTNI